MVIAQRQSWFYIYLLVYNVDALECIKHFSKFGRAGSITESRSK